MFTATQHDQFAREWDFNGDHHGAFTIALIQALTQVQEMTLTFIPKIVVILVVMALSGSFVGAHLYAFTEQLYGRIEHGY